MKHLKKILALVAVGVMAVSMAACGNSNDASKGNDSSSAAAESKDDNTLVMATNAAFPPYEYYEGDKIVGIDADIAQAIADKLGMELKIDDMDFNSIITAVQTGKADIALAGMTVTEDRLKNVNFTDSYATGVQVIIVKEDSAIATPDDLEGKKIGVQEGTTGHIYCSDDYGEDNVIAYTTGANAIEALKTGKVDCVVIDNEPAKEFVAANTGLKILDTEYVTEDYAIAVGKDNDELLDKVDKALNELKEDGTVQQIVNKYIKAE